MLALVNPRSRLNNGPVTNAFLSSSFDTTAYAIRRTRTHVLVSVCFSALTRSLSHFHLFLRRTSIISSIVLSRNAARDERNETQVSGLSAAPATLPRRRVSPFRSGSLLEPSRPNSRLALDRQLPPCLCATTKISLRCDSSACRLARLPFCLRNAVTRGDHRGSARRQPMPSPWPPSLSLSMKKTSSIRQRSRQGRTCAGTNGT